MNPFKSLRYLSLDLSLNQAGALYKKRLAQTKNKLKTPWLIIGPPAPPDGLYSWLNVNIPFFQDPMLAYLTGINQAGCALFLSPNYSVLFIPEENLDSIRWEGPYFGLSQTNKEHYKNHFGVDDIKLTTHLLKHLKNTPLSLSNVSESTQKNCQIKAQQTMLKKKLEVTKETLNLFELEERLVIDDAALAIIKKAIRFSKQAFLTAIKTLEHANNEADIASTLLASIYKLSPFGPSFPPIVASSKQACILHYTDNNNSLQKEGLLLVDFGIRYQSYVTDITRTIPISGHFHPIDAIIYNIVLETQSYVESLIKPGITLSNVNEACWAFMNTLIKKRVLDKGGSIKTDYKTAPHQVGHLIGIAVHDGDTKRNYRNMSLKRGYLISNEPGFYGTVCMPYKQKRVTRTLGIRIEDMLLITEDGCENLSQSIPKANPNKRLYK